MKKILIALVAILALTQCTKPIEPGGGGTSFATTVTEYGLYSGVTPLYAYNIDRHQTSVTKAPTYRFVMQTDDQTEFMAASLSAAPTELNQPIDVTLRAVGAGASGVKEGLHSMKIVKIDQEKAWLWSDSETLGLVIAMPLF